jgi:hypothetical protein
MSGSLENSVLQVEVNHHENDHRESQAEIDSDETHFKNSMIGQAVK